jgi:sialidase-1
MKIQFSDIVKRGDEGYGYYRIPGIIMTVAGTLIVTYECRVTLSDWDTRAVAIKRSTDGGKTWSVLQILGHAEDVAANNPVLIAGKNGTIYFLYQLDYLRTFIRISEDDGLTFSRETEITQAFEGFRGKFDFNVCAIGPGHGIELANGRLIVPVWLAYSPTRQHRPSVVSVLISDDKGKNWYAGGDIIKGQLVNPSETTAVQLNDGSVMLNIRNENEIKRRALSFSQNGATGWSEPVFDENLPDPTCFGSLASAGSKIFFSNCRSEKGRNNLTISEIGSDGKATGEYFKIYDNAAYSDVTASPDGRKLYCFFERDNYSALTIAIIETG